MLAKDSYSFGQEKIHATLKILGPIRVQRWFSRNGGSQHNRTVPSKITVYLNYY